MSLEENHTPAGLRRSAAQSQPLEVQVAVHTERLDQVEFELLRARQRIHDLEGDRATLGMMVKQVEALTSTLQSNARQAALEAIDLAMKGRDELGRRRMTLRAQWVASGAAVGAGIISTIALFLR